MVPDEGVFFTVLHSPATVFSRSVPSSGGKFIIVVAIEHYKHGFCDSDQLDTLRDGAGELAVAAGLDDCAFLLDAHYRPSEHFPIGIAFVILQFT